MNYYLPELDMAFSQYWKARGDITITHVNLPELTKESMVSPNSVFHLLFNNGFQGDSYNAYFKEMRLTQFPQNIVNRISSKSATMKCYLSTSIDTTGSVNALEFSDEEISMFDILFAYRNDSTCNIDSVAYETLQSPLSQLVYVYLDYFVNGNVECIDTLITMSLPTRMLDALFNLYVTNECHKSLKIVQTFMDNDELDLYINRKIVKVTDEIVDDGLFTLVNPAPISSDFLYLYKNGLLVQKASYQLVCTPEDDPVSATIEPTDTMLPGDVFVAEYYSTTLTPPESPAITTVAVSEDYMLQDYIEEHIEEYDSPNASEDNS